MHSDDFLKISRPGSVAKINDILYYPQELIIYRSSGDQRYYCIYDVLGKWREELWQRWENNAWTNDYKYTPTYDAGGFIVSVLGTRWENNAWTNDYRGTMTNDSGGNVLYELSEFWQKGEWVPGARFISTYTPYGDVLTRTSEYYEAGAWVFKYLYSYTYNNYGHLILMLGQSWNNNAWVNDSRKTVSYNWYRLSMETYESWTGDAWVNTWQNSFSYDGSANLSSELVQQWTDTAWVNYGLYSFSRFAGLNSVLYRRWESGNWVNFSKCDYVNSNYYPVQADFYKWESGAWVTGEGMITLNFYLLTGPYSLSFVARRITVGYTIVTGIQGEDSPPGNFSLSQNYPNPFNPGTVISYQLPVNSNVTLKLFDIAGNEVAVLVDGWQSAGSYNYQLSINNYQLTSGVYFYRLQAGSFSASRKLLLLK